MTHPLISRALRAAVAGFCAGAVGCSAGTSAEAGPGDHTETRALSLQSDDWEAWRRTTATANITNSPAICSNRKGFFVTVQHASPDSRFYVKTWFFVENPEWKQFGTRQFASPPTCAMQYPYPSNDPKLLLAGKSTDNRIYVVEGELPEADSQVAPNPDWTGPWTQVSAATYTGSTSGRPALASSGSRVVLTYVNVNRLYAFHRALPFAHSWTGPVAAPAFPTDVSSTGIPAITYMAGSTNKFVIMVQGRVGATGGLYWIYFNGTAFQGSWARAFVPLAVESDPALEYDPEWGALTVYFQSGNAILQTSVHTPGEIGVYPFEPIANPSGAVIYGSPRAVFGGGIEGLRAAIVKGYDPLVPPEQQMRGFFLTEVTNGAPQPWP
jgi:hypothetical protein